MSELADKTNRIKTLTLVTGELPKTVPSDEEADKCPRASLYEKTLNSVMLNEQVLSQAPSWRKRLYRFLPFGFSEIIEAYFLRRDYDAIIAWGTGPALLFAAMLKFTGTKHPYVTLTSWISTPRKAMVLKRVHSHITRMVFWSSVQRDFAVNSLGIPPEKTRLLNKSVDQKFFRPMKMKTDMICSAGREMRDYPTLIEAMRGLDIKCHIAVALRGKLYDSIRKVYESKSVPSNITVGNLPPLSLRDLYARSRFVVIPLLPTDTDNGVTVIVEAMAMGKAVICSRTQGQTDVMVEGKTGLFVPPGDPKALREAILYLWKNPEIAEEMGREARERIEQKHKWDTFVNDVRSVVEDAVSPKHAKERETDGSSEKAFI